MEEISLYRQRAFSLIEVLITVLVLGAGLMGLAALQARMLQSELEAHQRAQAVLLIQDMADRLRSNPAAARAGNYSGNTVYGTGGPGCSTASAVERDLCAWGEALLGSSTKTSGNANIGSMIGARGCIETISASPTAEVTLRVSVAWQGLTSTVAPSISCGEGAYGDNDRTRRVVSTLVTLAFLGG